MSHLVLIVDDDTEYLELLGDFFESNNLKYKTACSVQEARQQLSKKEIFDLVLLDFNLPDKNGIEFISEIKAIDRGLPIIMVSAQDDTHLVVKAIQEGASDYILKPFDYSELFAKMGKLFSIRDFKRTEKELMHPVNQSKILGKSHEIKNLVFEAIRVSHSDAPVLVYGESGTGKTLLADLIHGCSFRNEHSFVTINCASIPDQLLESEFFGHVKGAFTGAIRDKVGKFEYADQGTIFLDEIGDLALDLQAKLLRVLQGNEFEKVGGLKTIKVNVRVIAATNRDLMELIQEGRFREDLYYRLSVFPIYVPPLRERKEDIPLLANYFVSYYARKANKYIEPLSKELLTLFMTYEWPGNVRELQNVIERAVVLADTEQLQIADFSLQKNTYQKIESNVASTQTLRDIEKNALLRALDEAGGNVKRTAEKLQISRDTVYRRLKKFHIGLKR